MPSEWPIRPLLWVLCFVTSAVLWVAEFSALLSAWPAALLLLRSHALCVLAGLIQQLSWHLSSPSAALIAGMNLVQPQAGNL